MRQFNTKTKDTTIGCDPEVFFMKGGKVYPAIGLIGGNKDSPKPCDGGALQEDNVMAEFNTDPVTNIVDFLSNIDKVYNQIHNIAIENGCTIGIHASKNIKRATLLSYPQSREFGCDPDFNAYTMSRNSTPDPMSLLRTCAGHIHIGYEVEGGHTFESSAYLTKYLDAYVGTFCVVNDKDTRRMTRYGKAGAFRPKPYGTEYRVPSNFWLTSKDFTTEIFNRSREGYRAAKRGVEIPNDVVRAINLQDVERCEEILKCLER